MTNTERVKEPIDPATILYRIDAAAKKGKFVYFRIFNTRTNKESFALHKGIHSYLFRDPAIDI